MATTKPSAQLPSGNPSRPKRNVKKKLPDGRSEQIGTGSNLADKPLQAIVSETSPDFISPNSLTEKELKELLSQLQAREHEGLSKPFTTWEDFAQRWRQIKRACKQGCFDQQLRAATEHLHKYLRGVNHKVLKGGDLSLYWKGRTVLYELNDIFHLDTSINQWTYDDGRDIYEEIQKLWEEKPDGETYSVEQRQILKEKVLFCAYFAHETKRRNDTATCIGQLENLLAFVTDVLVTDDMRCLSTRASLCYHLGSLYRRLEEHELGETMYTQAVELYYERIKKRAPDDYDDHLFTTRRVAMCIGLGFGWQNLTRGYLRRAENALAAARSMLAKSSDPLVPSYIELLYGTIRRCRAGNDRNELEDAIKSLQQASLAFKEQNHSRYEARVCWELALAYNLMGDPENLDKSEEQLKVVEEYAKQQIDLKWQANVHILRSRNLRKRGQYEEALNEAEVAQAVAKKCGQILPEVDALLTRGEAYFYLAEDKGEQQPDYDVARADFMTALQMLQKRKFFESHIGQTLNPKIASVCVLRIAQCYARAGEEAKANSYFAEWALVSSSIEHRWIRDLADTVRAEIEEMSQSFSISAKDYNSWNYSRQVRRLRKWLYARAMKQTNNNWAEAALLIGVERATLYQWRFSSRQQVKRARTTNKKSKA